MKNQQIQIMNHGVLSSSITRYQSGIYHHSFNNINWRDVQRKNVVNNVDMSSLILK